MEHFDYKMIETDEGQKMAYISKNDHLKGFSREELEELFTEIIAHQEITDYNKFVTALDDAFVTMPSFRNTDDFLAGEKGTYIRCIDLSVVWRKTAQKAGKKYMADWFNRMRDTALINYMASLAN